MRAIRRPTPPQHVVPFRHTGQAIDLIGKRTHEHAPLHGAGLAKGGGGLLVHTHAFHHCGSLKT